MDNLQDSSEGTAAKQPQEQYEDAVDGGGLNRKLASFGSLAEALPDYDAPPETPRTKGGFGAREASEGSATAAGGFGVREASEGSATAADPSATAAGVPDVNASHTWTPSQEQIIPPSPKEGEHSSSRDTFRSQDPTDAEGSAQQLHGDENAPPSGIRIPSLSGEGAHSHATQIDETEPPAPRLTAASASKDTAEVNEGYIPPSPRDVGLTSRDLDNSSPFTPRGMQTQSPFDDSPFTPRSRSTKSPFDEEDEQPTRSAADSSRDASLAEKAKTDASAAALEEAEEYNKRFGPSKGSGAVRAQQENGSAAAAAAQRAKDDAAATSDQHAATAVQETETSRPTEPLHPQLDSTEAADKELGGSTYPNGLAEERDADNVKPRELSALHVDASETQPESGEFPVDFAHLQSMDC